MLELRITNSAGTPICITGDQLAALLASQASDTAGGSGTGNNQSQTGAQQSPATGSNPSESVGLVNPLCAFYAREAQGGGFGRDV